MLGGDGSDGESNNESGSGSDSKSCYVSDDVSGGGSDGVSGAGSLVTLVFEALSANPTSQIVVGRLAPSGPGGEVLTAAPPAPYGIAVVP